MRIFIASILGILFSCFSPSQRVDDFGNDATKIPDIIILDTQVESETPEIFSLYPKSGYTEGGTEVTISGKNFKEGIDVFFGDVRAELKSFLSNTLIIVITPPNDEGKVDVKVQNPDGRFSILESGFEYKKRDEPIKGCIPKSCEPKPTVFKYDSSKAGFAVSTVELAAQFTNWGDGRIIMNDEGVNGDEISGDGIFTTLVFLKTGEYEYKFILNKNHWISDPDNKEVEPVFKNSVVKVKDGCTPEIINQTPLNGEIIGNKRVRIEVGYFLNGREIDKTGTYFIIDGKRYNAEFSKDKPVVFSEMELAEGAHWYSIVLRDGECNRIVSPSVFFIVKTEKRAPVANAGYTQVVEVGNKVVLDGTLSLDPYQISVDEFKWEVVSAPEPVVLNDEFATDPAGYNNDPNAVPKKVRSLVSFIPRKEGYYRFSLRVSNGDGESNLDETDVYVISKSQSNSKPVIKSEIRLDGTTVIIDASSSLGANSSALSFLWYEDIKNPERFSLSNTPSQRISITKDGTYFFYLIANDKIANSIPKTFFVFKKGNNIVAQDFSHSSKWFESSDVYEIFVRRFADGNGDGIGDLKGLKEKIPYLKELGVETIWLMPVFRSNDRDHGYHTIDYYTVEPDYGDNDDLLSFVSAAHREGMKVVLDMVINHTSRRHPFFIEALNMNPMFRDFYIWFDNPSQNLYDKYGYGREMGGSRLTLETGWAEIPDINYSNPIARQYIYNMVRFWMDPNNDGDFSDGVDGFRIDHVTGPSHSVWMNLRRFVKSINPNVILIAEVFRDFDNNNQGYGIKDYYNGEFDVAFTFPYYWTINSIVNGNNKPNAIDGLRADLRRKFSEGVTHSFFIQNHDVPHKSTALNDYGGYNEKGISKQISAATLMFVFPNSPQIFYGEELGITEYRGYVPWQNFSEHNPLYNFYRSMYKLRREIKISANSEFFHVQNSQEDFVYSFVVRADEGKILGLINMKDMYIDTVSLNIGVFRDKSCGILSFDSLFSYSSIEVEENYNYLFVGPLKPYEVRLYRINEKSSVLPVKVRFNLNTSSKSFEISAGKSAFISGDVVQLGNWVPNRMKMTKVNSESSYYETYICNNTQIEYKYLIDYGALERWDGVEFSGENRKVIISGDVNNEMEIFDTFGLR